MITISQLIRYLENIQDKSKVVLISDDFDHYPVDISNSPEEGYYVDGVFFSKDSKHIIDKAEGLPAIVLTPDFTE
jgi:hypothetical protein